uniref:Uncharacterized protein n=1 Tax=Anabas testudineus TaxID=64144 RepID=A0A3Q1JMQ7_ANATE
MHFQDSRIEDQRCALPQILTQCSPTKEKSASDSDSCHEISPADKEQFLKMINHAQRGRMEEQRCYLQSSRTEAFFTAIACSQARRIDDQRVPLPMLPGIGVNSDEKGNGSDAEVGSSQH